MFVINSGYLSVGNVQSSANGTDWWSNGNWSPASNEAEQFDSREDAEAEMIAAGITGTIVEIEEGDVQVGRSDGLNNSMSINSGVGCTWDDVELACEDHDGVDTYDRKGNRIVITFVDGNQESFDDPQAAFAGLNQYA